MASASGADLAVADDSPAPKAVPTGQIITPNTVAGEIGEDGRVKAIDYEKLVNEFGTKLIDQDLLDRFERVTGHKPHRFLRRKIVFSERDFGHILDLHEKKLPFFLYTGRGPSSDSMHVGHTQIFDFCKWIQDVFDVPLIIMLTDDEKFLFSTDDRPPEQFMQYARQNCKDIIALGFDEDKTFIFSDYDFMGGAFYRNITRFAKLVTDKTAKKVFGFDEDSNIGKIHFGSIQGASAFASSFPHIFGDDAAQTKQIPCLIPCAIDQDPYFRVTRDCASSLGLAKPSLIHSRFLTALQGAGAKMSASVDSSAIFMSDTPKKIKDKINKHAFSGGQTTAEEQREKGGDPEADVSFQYLRFFMEDDERLETIRKDYLSGQLLTGELKQICVEHLQVYVKAFQERREKATDEVVATFMAQRPLKCQGISNVRNLKGQKDSGSKEVPTELTQNQRKKLEKEKRIAEKKAAKEAAKSESSK